MDVDECSRLVAEAATARARTALLRRRPDLARRGGKPPEVAGDEEAQVVLDRLAFLREVADRLGSDMTTLVWDARQYGASWARVGLALHESPQTAFNRYRHLERAGAGKRPERQSKRRRAAG